MTPSRRIDEARRVIALEADSLKHLGEMLASDSERGEAFSKAVDLILGVKSHLIVVGVGKSGHIGQKLAASFASTGTPSFFMHPTEASHGDLGMVTPSCAVLAISNSGESREMVDVLHYCRKSDIPVIGMTRDPKSTLGRASTVLLRLPDSEEACINGLAPTTSTTNTLALGDALVVATMAEKGISKTDFGRRHPAGKLGRGLQTVGDWLHLNPHDLPATGPDDRIEDVVLSVSEGQSGCAAVVSSDGAFLGHITDGDLRRAINPDMFTKTAADIMTRSPMVLSEDQLMSEVISDLTERSIGNAFIIRDDRPVGVVTLKGLMAQGYV